jgi:hypothetical protein
VSLVTDYVFDLFYFSWHDWSPVLYRHEFIFGENDNEGNLDGKCVKFMCS